METQVARANWLLGLLGAAAGGGLGYGVAFYLGRQGFYMPALPGALLGLGCGMLSRGRSIPLGIVCGVLALALGVISQWHIAPFKEESSLIFFIAHLANVGPGTLSLVLLGTLIAAWLGTGRQRYVRMAESSLPQA